MRAYFAKTVLMTIIISHLAITTNFAYASSSYNTRVDGYEFGMEEMAKYQENAKKFSVSENGDISFGNERLDNSLKDENGNSFNTKNLSADQSNEDVAQKFYNSGKVPDIQNLQGIHGNVDEDGLNNIAHTSQSILDQELDSGTEVSYEAQLYGMMNDINNAPTPNFNHDPALNKITGVLKNSTGNPFGDCAIDKSIISQNQTIHTPNLVDCSDGGFNSCSLTHNPVLAIFKYINEKAIYGYCGENCISYYIGEFPNNSDPLNPGNCTHSTITTELQLTNKDAIKSVVIDYSNYAGSIMVYIPAKEGGHDRILFAYNSHGDSIVSTDMFDCSELSAANTVYPFADITDIVKEYKNGDVLKIATQYKGAIPYSVLNVKYDPTLVVTNDEWKGTSECLTSAKAIYTGELQGKVTCQNNMLSDTGLFISSGVQLDPKYLKQEFGLPSSCTLASVEVYSDNTSEQQKLPSCRDLEEKGCGFISSKCVLYGSNQNFNNACLKHQSTYDCGYENDIEIPKEDVEYKCPGAVACMGIDCLNIVIGKDSGEDDFNKALGLLQQSQGAANDMSCTPSGTKDDDGNPEYNCNLFPGTAETCNNWDIVGMGNNCCSGAPVAGDWAQTTRQSLHIAKQSFVKFKTISEDFLGTVFQTDTAVIGTEMSFPYGQMWDVVKNFTPIGKVENAIMEPMTNALNNILPHAGEVFAGAVYYAQDLIIQYCMEQYVMPAIMNTINAVIGSAAASGSGTAAGSGASSMIQQSAVNMLEKMGVSQATAQSAVQMVSSVISVIGWVYAVYSVADLVIGMLTECEDREIELQSKVMQKNCDFVGSWCAEDIPLIGCVKHKSAYCCFTSPLSRILNKQIKFGLKGCNRLWPNSNPACAFGSPQSPDCSPITLEQLETVDWTQIDMTEWLYLLKASGALQSENISLDKITNNGLPVGGRTQ